MLFTVNMLREIVCVTCVPRLTCVVWGFHYGNGWRQNDAAIRGPRKYF